jgi:SAM-dependent methyltransferase
MEAMQKSAASPPYFEKLFAQLEAGDPQTLAAFGRHVHWGYWPEPASATGTAEDYGAAAERLCRQVCAPAGIRDGNRVLDVGCGFGGTIASLNERHAGLQLVGVNIDARQLDRAGRWIIPQNGNSLEWIEADAAALPFQDATFDVVLAVECIFHFDRPRFLREAGRVLRPGGNLTISDFVPEERALPFLELANFSADESIRWSYGQIDLTCTSARYAALAAEAGLRLTQDIDITSHTLPTYDFLRKSVENWPRPGEMEQFQKATRSLEKASRKGFLQYRVLRFDRI